MEILILLSPSLSCYVQTGKKVPHKYSMHMCLHTHKFGTFTVTPPVWISDPASPAQMMRPRALCFNAHIMSFKLH